MLPLWLSDLATLALRLSADIASNSLSARGRLWIGGVGGRDCGAVLGVGVKSSPGATLLPSPGPPPGGGG